MVEVVDSEVLKRLHSTAIQTQSAIIHVGHSDQGSSSNKRVQHRSWHSENPIGAGDERPFIDRCQKLPWSSCGAHCILPFDVARKSGTGTIVGMFVKPNETTLFFRTRSSSIWPTEFYQHFSLILCDSLRLAMGDLRIAVSLRHMCGSQGA